MPLEVVAPKLLLFSCTSLGASFEKLILQKCVLQMHFLHGCYCFYSNTWSIIITQNKVRFVGGIVVTPFHTALFTLFLIMERNCELSHCAECMRPVFPCETKGPSVAERATVQCHHSAEAAGSVGAHTQLLRPHRCCGR